MRVLVGLTPAESGRPYPPPPGAIQQQPEPLDGAGRHKIQEMQAVHAMQTHLGRIGMNGKTNATK